MRKIDDILTVKIDPAELVKLAGDGKTIIINPNAEESLVKLLAIQREVDGAVEAVKSEIERHALEFNPNFRSLKSNKLKINYSASGAKYKQTGDISNHSKKFWTKKTTWSLNSEAVDAYFAKNRRLPKGISSVERAKTLRIKEVDYAE